VLDDAGNVVGVVGQGNNLFVQGVANDGALTVSLPGDARCSVAYRFAKPSAGIKGLSQTQAPCLLREGTRLSSR